MKKILLVLSILLLSGCYENSGYITKSCYKEEISNSLYDRTTYTFTFKEDIINELVIINDYEDVDKNTINSIKSSIEAQNRFLNLSYDILMNDENHYKIQYNIDMNNREYWDKFNVTSSRTQLVNKLKEDGFTCE